MIMGENIDVNIIKRGLQVIVPKNVEKDSSNVLQRAQDYINGLKQINEAILEDITHTNRMILDKGKEQIKNLERTNAFCKRAGTVWKIDIFLSGYYIKSLFKK